MIMSGKLKRARDACQESKSEDFVEVAKERRQEVTEMNEYDEIDANLYRCVNGIDKMAVMI